MQGRAEQRLNFISKKNRKSAVLFSVPEYTVIPSKYV